MLDEIIKSTKENLLERISSPILGGFAISWCIWNYRFLMVLFSKNTVSDTFSLIDTTIFQNYWSLIFRGFSGPFVTMMIYIFVYPYPSRFVYGVIRRQQKALKDVRHKIDQDTLLTRDESNKLRAETIEQIKVYESLINQRNADIEALRGVLTNTREQLTAALNRDKEPIKSSIRPLTSSQTELIQKIGINGGNISREELIGEASKGLDRVQADFDLDELQKRNYISRIQGALGVGYNLEQPGRSLLIEKGLSP